FGPANWTLLNALNSPARRSIETCSRTLILRLISVSQLNVPGARTLPRNLDTLPNWYDGVATNAAGLKYSPPFTICAPPERIGETPVAFGRIPDPPPKELEKLGEVTAIGRPSS